MGVVMGGPLLNISSSVPDTEVNKAPFRLLSLPQEVLAVVYKTFFAGIRLTPHIPRFGSLENDFLLVSERPRLALLLMCKSQQQAVDEALWQCATVCLTKPTCLSSLAVGDYACNRIQAIEINAALDSPEDSYPLMLTSRVLRGLPALQRIVIKGHQASIGGEISFRHSTFASEIEDPTSELRSCIKHVLSDLIKPWAFEDSNIWPWKPEVIISFHLTCRNNNWGVRADVGVAGDLEMFDVGCRFSSHTWAVTGWHKGKPFSILQKCLVEAVGVIPLGLPANALTANQESREQIFWAVRDEYFSDIEFTHKSALAFYEAMDDESLDKTDRLLVAYKVGEALFREYSTQSYFFHSVFVTITDDNLWELWSRLLKIPHHEVELVLDRQWERTHQKLSWGGLLGYREQKEFFTELFDATKEWPPERYKGLLDDDNESSSD